jgi:hypothetical protein
LTSPRDQPVMDVVVGKPCVTIHHPLLHRVRLSALSSYWQPPTVAAAVQPHSFYSAAARSSQATTTDHTSWVSMLQLWKGWSLCQGLPPAEAEQLTTYPSACGESVEGPAERPSTTILLCQLHHRGGDTHGRGSTCGYILSQ